MADSSLIRSAHYLPEERALELCFTSGRKYLYLGVPLELAQRFASAASKGAFFNSAIRGRFVCRELLPEPTPTAPRGWRGDGRRAAH